MLKGGDTGAIIVPGDLDNSMILIAVRHTDPDLKMPPKEKLPDAEISVLEQWVKMGAPDPRAPSKAVRRDLWSTKPLHSPPVPEVANAKWVRDPIDAFVLFELEKRGIHPVKPAAKRDLVRRAAFDLLGLPPTPEEVEQFVRDASESSFAGVVDRYLESPQFGVRWGRHWLDLARYADSNGFDQNTTYPNAWRYRDYVVNAFNADLPYNEFIREQLAGDLLAYKDNDERHRKWIATGFLMLGPKNLAEPNREKLMMDVADEQIDVTSRAFLGLTVSCARCHDHKFDPIPTRDYYALAGIFRSTQTVSGERPNLPGASIFSDRPLGTEEEAARMEAYEKKLGALEAKRDRARTLAKELPGGIDSKQLDGVVLDNLEAEVVGSWKLSNYSTNFVDKNYLQDGNEKAGKGKKLVRFRPEIPADGLYEVRLAYTARLNRAKNVPVRVSGGGKERTVFLNQTVEPKYDKAFETLGFFELREGTNNTVEVLTEGTKGFVVVDAVQFLPQDVVLASKLKKRSPAGDAGNEMMMEGINAATLPVYESQLEELEAKAPPRMPMAMAVREGEPRNVHLLVRGDVERPGEEVPRGFLSVIDHMESGALGTDSSGRLQLANWIADAGNPLTARVMVNRIWQQLFGRGLVATPDNFGSMGEMPSHPELLDYLASEFIREGWSIKHLIRRIMLTSTYQLSALDDETAPVVDPENRYLWKMNRKRLDAESLRDSILRVNGSLDLALGGESLNGLAGSMAARPNGSDILQSRRRSIYLPVFPGNLNELFQVFDFPDPNGLAGKRYVTTAPTQALFLMNGGFMMSEAAVWSGKLLGETGKSEAELIDEVYAKAFARPPAPAEKARALQFISDFGKSLAQVEPDANARRSKSWQAFCHAIFETTEFRFVE
jgi:hypothetical protein